jgi:hypothetical protein
MQDGKEINYPNAKKKKTNRKRIYSERMTIALGLSELTKAR